MVGRAIRVGSAGGVRAVVDRNADVIFSVSVKDDEVRSGLGKKEAY